MTGNKYISQGNPKGRPFRARGARIIRCDDCQMPKDYCICSYSSLKESQVVFWLLMHRKEQYKPTNTGRLILDCVSDCRRSIWDRTNPPEELLVSLKQNEFRFMVLFPTDEATDIDPKSIDMGSDGKKICVIIPDGTWRQASKMMNRSPYLDDVPRIGLWATKNSSYNLRKAKQSYQLCTAEVAIEVMKRFKQHSPADSLEYYYQKFNYNYAVARKGLGEIKVPEEL